MPLGFDEATDTLSPACKMDTGKDGSGLELSHMRKLGSTVVSGMEILHDTRRLTNNFR